MTTQNAQPTQADIFLKELREKTATAHTSLEELPVSASIVKPDVTLEEYKRYLQLTLPAQEYFEKNVFPQLSEIIPDLSQRNKTDLIRKDLSHLSAEGGKEDAKVMLPENKTVELTMPFCLGAMYVVEGSSLGGRVILKNIEKSLGLTQENGANFFTGYGKDTGPLWQQFLSILKDYPKTKEEEEQIIEGANYAFEVFQLTLSQ